MTYSKVLLSHLAAFVTALVLLVCLDQSLRFLFPGGRTLRQESPPHSIFIPHLDDPTRSSEKILETYFREKKFIIFGSSELTGAYPEIPHRWIPKHTGLPTLAIGQGGFQCLPILFVLYKFREHLDEHSNIAVIISPVWFRDGDSSLAALLPYAKQGDFRNIDTEEPAAEAIRNFISRKEKDFGVMPLEVQLFLSGTKGRSFLEFVDGLSRSFMRLLKERSYFYDFLVRSKQVEVVSSPDFKAARYRPPTFNWEQEGKKLIEDHRENSKGNKFGFYDSSLATHRHSPPTTLKAPAPGNHEFQALMALVEFLSSRKVKALFIQHPMNALAYTNLEVYNEQAQKIRDLLAAHSMPYLDFTNMKYHPAWLSDYAHFSAYGWQTMNEFLVEELNKRVAR